MLHLHHQVNEFDFRDRKFTGEYGSEIDATDGKSKLHKNDSLVVIRFLIARSLLPKKYGRKTKENKPAQIQTKQYELLRICHLIIKIDGLALG